MTITIAALLDQGDLNKSPAASKAVKLGSLLGEGGGRLVTETVAVVSNAATPTYAVKRLLSCKVLTGTTGTGEKAIVANGNTAVRTVRETLAVASAAATTTFPALQLLYAKTAATGAPAVKACDIAGATPGTGHAAPAADGLTIVFNAETTGTGTVDAIYLTAGGTAATNSGGTSIAFLASEVTGTATALITYLTTDKVSGATAALTDDETTLGLY